MTFRGLVESVESTTPRGFLASDRSLGATFLPIYGADAFLSATNTGSVVIDGTTYSYSGVTVSADESVTPSTLVISPGLAQDEVNGEPVELVSSSETKYARVSTGDGIGDPVSVRVPHNLKAYSALTDGVRTPNERETVDVDRVNGELLITNVIGVSDLYDASNTPIVTSTAGGERVQIDGDGITLYTDDPIQTLSYTAISLAANASNNAGGIAADDAGNTYMVGADVVAGTGTGYIKKFGPTGVLLYKVTLAATSTPHSVRLDPAGNPWVCATNSPGGIYKYNPATGAFVSSVLVGTNVIDFAIDSTGRFYVLTGLSSDYKIYSTAGALVSTVATASTGKNIAVDKIGNVAIAIGTADQILYYSAAGALVTTIAATKCGGGVVFDSLGNIVATNNSAGAPVLGVRFDPLTGGILNSWTVQANSGSLLLWAGSSQLLTIDPSRTFVYWRDPLLERVVKFNAPGNLFAAVQLSTLLGRLLGLNATIAGNLEVDSITSANGLQMLSQLQLAGGATALSGGFAVNADGTGAWPLLDNRITPTLTNGTGTSEIVVASWSLPAGYFTAGQMAEIKLLGQVSSTATLTWKVRCGAAGTTADALLIQFTTTAAGVANAHVMLDSVITCLTAGASGTVTAGGVANTASTQVGPLTGAFAAASVDTTQARFLTVTVTQSASQTLTTRSANLSKLRG